MKRRNCWQNDRISAKKVTEVIARWEKLGLRIAKMCPNLQKLCVDELGRNHISCFAVFELLDWNWGTFLPQLMVL